MNIGIIKIWLGKDSEIHANIFLLNPVFNTDVWLSKQVSGQPMEQIKKGCRKVTTPNFS